MSLINSSILLGIADKAASQYNLVRQAFLTMSMSPTAANSYYQRSTATEDPDVEIPLNSTYYTVDTSLTLATAVRSGMAPLLTVVTSMDTHFSRVGQTGSWDGYLTAQNARVSDYFNQVYYLSKGSYMKANNVFSEGTDTLGTAEVVAGPAITFTAGINYGTGASTNLASGSNFAATQLRAYTLTAIGGTDLDLRITGKDVANTTTTIDVTISAGTPASSYVDIGTSTDRFLAVTNIGFVPAGDQGTSGDMVSIQNKKERAISL